MTVRTSLDVRSLQRLRKSGRRCPIIKVISGGQTGVDRIALDAAAACGIPVGGWCPRGRRAEDGVIPTIYPLVETPSRDYRERTRWNVRDSDGTLILTTGELTGGTALTWRQALRLRRPVFVADLRREMQLLIEELDRWAAVHRLRVLNVAGPRASRHPEVFTSAARLLRAWWRAGTSEKT
jgi:predicted Rossmann-fold nucleotide-binding protein